MNTAHQIPDHALFGQYRILRLLGRGGMGEVYEVEHRVLRKRYALKLLPVGFADEPESLKRFEREAEVMANLEHPNIVKVDDFGETNGRYWIRMELINGPKGEITLGDYAQQRGGKIEQSEFARILEEILEGLAHAHTKGVVHRDLKPANILLEQAAERLRVKVSDFGIARVIGEEFIRSQAQLSVSRSIGLRPSAMTNESLTSAPTIPNQEGASTRALLGTWEYMSPEQRRGTLADARSDVYALGLMCYRLLTGEELGRKSASQLAPGIWLKWDDFIDKSLEQKPEARFSTATEMLETFRNIVVQGNLPASKTTPKLNAPPDISPRAEENASTNESDVTASEPSTTNVSLSESAPETSIGCEQNPVGKDMSAWGALGLFALTGGLSLLVFLIIAFCFKSCR